MAATACAVGVSCQDSTFACDHNAQCMAEASGGQCETNGYCSFPADDCPSGRRYGDLAGGGLAGFCVVDDTAGTDGTTTGSMSDVSTTSAAMGDEGSDEVGDTAGVDTADSVDSSGGPETDDGNTTGALEDPDLLLWLQFETLQSGGAPLVDSSGNEHHGTCAEDQCPTLVEGPVGLAGRFDGIGQFVEIPYDPAFDLVDALTLAAWVRLDGKVARDFASVVGKNWGDSSLNSYELYYLASTTEILFGMDAETYGVADAEWEPGGEWMHVAGTWDGDNMLLYFDGVVVGQDDSDGPPAHEPTPLLVGADLAEGAPNGFWPGAIDELRVYSRCLDADEVAALAVASN